MPEVITNSDAQYAFDIVDTICTEVGPGLPGSSQERERAAMLRKELVSHLGAGNVAVEEFTLAPAAALPSVTVNAVLLLIAALLNLSIGRLAGISTWLTSIAAVTFSIIPLVLFVFQFVLGVALLDPFLKKKQSLNLIGTLRKPGTGSVKRLLILSGHHDSAWEFTWLRLLRYGFFICTATLFIGYIAMPAMSIVQLAGVISGNAGAVRLGTLGWAVLAYPIAPSIIIGLFFTSGGKNGGNVPGAVDNLSASALAVAMCRFLVRNPAFIPDDTEIRFISFGSEEAGLRGSRNYVRRHLDELRRLDVRMLNIEMVAHPEMAILTSDSNGTVKLSPEMVSGAVAAAERAGVPFTVKAGSIGTITDAVPFSQSGLKATTLNPFKFPQQWVAFYHQRSDGPEMLTLEPLLNVLKLTLEWVRSGGE